MVTSRLRVSCAAVAALSLLAAGCSSSGGETPLPPGAPTGLTASAGDGQVTLSWTPVSGASAYAAYYGTAAGVTKITGTRVSGITAPPHVVSGLTNGTPYHFVVTAVGAGGESAESAEASATPAPAQAFTQADLTGDWDVLTLSTNSSPGWSHVLARLDAAGQVEVLESLDDNGDTALPPPGSVPSITVASDGTVRLATGGPTFHGSMTRSKTLVFATDEEGSPTAVRRRLWVFRKRVPGVTYSSADIAGFAFAIHGIYAGPGYGWMYGTGTTDAAGVLSLTEVHDSSGGSGSPGQVGTLAIDATGLVVNVGGVLRGVMTPDKNAIFFVDTTGDTPHDPGLLVVLRTGRTLALADLAGDRVQHAVVSGAAIASSTWFRGENTIDATGLRTFTSFENSAGSTALPPARQLDLSPAGVLTSSADPSLHGQLAWDSSFYVFTTGTAAAPALGVNAR